MFFENLAKTNQLLYTTQSPFLIDSDHLNRVRSVYHKEGAPIVPLVEMWAKNHAFPLPEGWKVKVAAAAKKKALHNAAALEEMEASPGLWSALFKTLGVRVL